MSDTQAAPEANEPHVEQPVEDPDGAPESNHARAEDGPAMAPVDGDAVGATGADYLEDLKRLQAEFANYRKRMMKDQAGAALRGVGRLVERLLPVMDNLQRAMDHGEGGPGIELVLKDLKDALASEGLQEIAAGEGTPFDPNVHEAVDSVEDPDVTELTCRSLYRAGYTFSGRVLRPAMVVVARPPEAAPETAPQRDPAGAADADAAVTDEPSRGE